MAKSAVNPFQFASPLREPDELVGRDAELARLLELAEGGTLTMLEAPRRFGKTSLLVAATRLWPGDAQRLAVLVDLSRVLTVEEAARRFELALRAVATPRLREVLGELLGAIRLRLGPIELGPRSARPQTTGADHLHALLDVPAEAARRTGHRALVCLDEFQDVLAVDGLDGLLRSHLQHQADSVSYVFAGSEPSLLRSLFTDRSRPLYGQAKPLPLERIDPALLAARIRDLLERTGRRAGAGAEVVAGAGAGHPQRTMQLAWHLWDRTPAGKEADEARAAEAVDAALTDATPELDAVWRRLAGNERRVAAALAQGLAPTGPRARRATGLATGSAAHRALERLIAQGDAEQTPAGPALVDPLLSLWLAREHAGDAA